MDKEKINHGPSAETGAVVVQSLETVAVDHDADEVNITQVFHFFHRHWRLICGAALIPAIITVLYTVLLVPREYRTSATLVIAGARLSSASPPPLTVQGYQKLLESDAVMYETRHRLIEKGVLDEASRLRLGRDVETQIFVSRQSEVTSLAPMLQIVARGSTPEKAAQTANTHAEVFLERTRLLAKGTNSSMLHYVEEEYPKARKHLTQLENSLVSLTEERQALYAEAVIRWKKTIADDVSESNRLRARYRAESERLIEGFSTSHNWEIRRKKMVALSDVYSEMQSELVRVKGARQEKELIMATLRQQLAETPPNLTTHKAITDDALWRALAGKNGKEFDWSSFEGRSLVSQQTNPLFTELSSRAVQIKLDLGVLLPRSEQLSAEIAGTGQELNDLERALKAEESELSEIRLERDAGYSELSSNRDLLANRFRTQQEQELMALEQQTDTLLEQTRRDVTQQRLLYTELAKNFNEVTLTKAQQDVEDVVLAAPAVAVQHPEPRGTVTSALLSLIIGGLGGLLVGVVRDMTEDNSL